MSLAKSLFKLGQTRLLWFTFSASLLMMLGFGLVTHFWQFGIIDEIYQPEQVLIHIANMSPTQRIVHAWMTATLDVAYPLAYGSFFIGMALRFFGPFGPWLAAPSLVLILTDLTEGVVQICLLMGDESLVWIKAIVTPLKLGLFVFGLIIAALGLLIAIYRKLRKGRV